MRDRVGVDPQYVHLRLSYRATKFGGPSDGTTKIRRPVSQQLYNVEKFNMNAIVVKKYNQLYMSVECV